MPVTFLAHQAPVLPLARRWPGRLDGVALVIGSMAPDMAYVLVGSRFEIWAHGFPWVVLFCVPVTVIVSWLVVRVLAPVVPDHLPPAGRLHLRDYRGLAVHRFGVVRTALGTLVGALSHVALDHFTHEWGWFARNVAWYDDRVVDARFLGREWTFFRVVQYTGHVGGSALCVLLLWRYGRSRWMADRAAAVAPYEPSPRTQVAVWGALGAGLTAGLAWVARDSQGSATDILRVSGAGFLGLCVAAAVIGRTNRAPSVSPVRPAGPRTGAPSGSDGTGPAPSHR